MATSSWPPSEGLSTPTVALRDAILTLSATVMIRAPAALVLDVLRKTPQWVEWNTWIPNVTYESQPAGVPTADELHKGTIFTEHVIMDASKPTKTTATRLIITDISTPESPSSYINDASVDSMKAYTADLSTVYRIAWKGDGGFPGLRSERFHEMIIRGESECEVRTWEVMGGVLARTVKWFYQKTLNEKFELWCSDLKKRSEALATQGTVPASS
ncbi:hypothetical protein B0A48_12402 [Cryoendolithus antarcticus]|uniref:Coenzyme Q-binding protein COQ10 START domain-containing protein n=1 Tax=Cryoendolithus antarcticus TaxID=1507870 RepID=A0A1V8SS91_9PEZI|nr:hypothetical protein B0A48_12402 [Cryoendolithus antarcticus]